jgi:dihydropteroate synthase
MFKVQIIDFALPSTRELYAKFYSLPAGIQLQDCSGYEFFDTGIKSESLISKISQSALFIKPIPDYLKSVYGLILRKKCTPVSEELQESFPEIYKILQNADAAGRVQVALNSIGKQFKTPVIMGILNVTPDSFSDGGKYDRVETALQRAGEMLADGVDIIDIGGESTRPGSELVSLEEELHRVIPVITAIKTRFPEAVVSIDTNKSGVASEAVHAGAALVNDISGGTFDKKMIETVAGLKAAYCIMHTPAPPKTMQANIHYTNVIAEIYQFLAGQAERAQKAGISDIIIDPGIGFGKTIENNYEILSRIREFRTLGFPILIGASRKSFLGKSLDLLVNERDIASTLVDMFAVTQGVQIIRTHNTKNAGQLKKICQSLQTQHV